MCVRLCAVCEGCSGPGGGAVLPFLHPHRRQVALAAAWCVEPGAALVAPCLALPPARGSLLSAVTGVSTRTVLLWGRRPLRHPPVSLPPECLLAFRVQCFVFSVCVQLWRM